MYVYDVMAWSLKPPNNFVICGQKHKVWVLVYQVRSRGTLLDQN